MMMKSAARTSRPKRRKRTAGLLAGCALAAVLASQPHAAQAQGFNGTAVVDAGSASITTAPGVTDITVFTAETVINWTPFDTASAGEIDFLPAGNVATYREGESLATYTVLNRILPVDEGGSPVARAVRFDGTVFSLIGNAPGGNIFFYSPTGIIVGPTAVFSVGSLILTTNDIQYVPNDEFSFGSIYGPGGVIQFRGPDGSQGFVDIQAGAQIAASGVSAYVAVAAPRVEQHGFVQSDGSIAYIAAEQLDLTINAGLFDIQILEGTTDPNGVVHTGTTTGFASTGLADQQRISLVALPKLTALTMLLEGAIGYAPAASAANDGSSVVLSAGYETDVPTSVPAAAAGNIDIGNAVFSNRLEGYATGGISVGPDGGDTLFDADASFYAFETIDLTAETGEQILAGNALSLSAGRAGVGGDIRMATTGTGVIGVANSLSLTASESAMPFLSSPSGDAAGGSILVHANGGSISSLDLTASTNAFAGAEFLSGGDGQGGMIELIAEGGGTISSSFLYLTAIGVGGDSGDTAGDGIGGSISIADRGGSLDLGLLIAFASGVGGFGDIASGNGTGGRIIVDIASQAQNWDAFFGNAGARGGGSFPGGTQAGNATALPDAISLSITGTGSLNIATNLGLNANSRMSLGGSSGFAGQAGGILVDVSGGGALTVGNVFAVTANALLDLEAPDPDAVSSPDQRAGTVTITADGGDIAAGLLFVEANAVGAGALLSAGSATGGSAAVSALNGGTILIDDGVGDATLQVTATAHGAPGGAVSDATGGTAELIAEDGSITVAGSILVAADGRASEFFDSSQPGTGFDATGGTASVELRAGSAGTAQITTGDLTVSASGDARGGLSPGPGPGDPVGGDGGDGTGGTASMLVEAGSLTAGQTRVISQGLGAASSASAGPGAFRSGDGTGGTSTFTLLDGVVDAARLTLDSRGLGGGGGPAATEGETAADAGDGTGGTTLLATSGGSLTVADRVDSDARGFGGVGMAHLAGGSAGAGGNGAGGTAAAQLADGALALGAVTLVANGLGGDGSAPGEGSGGAARFSLIDTAAGPLGPRSLGSLELQAGGLGGFGPAGAAESDAGFLSVTVESAGPANALIVTGDLIARAGGSRAAPGDGFAASISGAPLQVGGNAIIVTARDASIAAGMPLVIDGDFNLIARSLTATGEISAGGNVDIEADQGMALETLDSGGTTMLQATNGAIGIADLGSVGPVTASGTAVDIRSTGALAFDGATATGGDLTIRAAVGLTLAQASATGRADLRSSNGDVHATGTVTADEIDISANGDVLADADLLATGELRVDAGETFILAGLGRGASIFVDSSDIALGAGAQLGERGITDEITFVNRLSTQTTFIGGVAPDAPGYSLDQDEAARLFADSSIEITTGGHVAIGDLAMSFGAEGNIGSGGTLEISTPAEVAITGAVELTASSADDTFLIDPALIELDTDTGSIALLDTDGNPLGRLTMIGDRIAIATGDVLEQLDDTTDFAAVNALLDEPGGNEEPLRAGTLRFDVVDGIYIQNTGASEEHADRRGFTASDVFINTASPDTRIAINGLILDGGGEITGLVVEPRITINDVPAAGGGQFDPLSTINGCVIGAECAFVPGPEFGDPPGLTGDELDRPLEPGTGEGSFSGRLFELRENEPLITPPLVDEPITGIGNDDLWLPECDPQREGVCPAEEGGE